MPELLDISKIQVGLDLATSIALIVSAIGVMWRVSTISRKLQKQRIESIEEQAQITLVKQREQARVQFLLIANNEIAFHIRSLVSAFNNTDNPDYMAANKESKEKEIFHKTQECWEWIKDIETRAIAIGTHEQWKELQVAKRYFLQTIDTEKTSGTHFQPRDMIRSLTGFQKEIIVDIRTVLNGESEQEARDFTDEHLDYSRI